MSRECVTFDHTADVGLAASADSLAELYEALALGLARFICASPVAALERRTIAVAAGDLEALAVDFLWEVMQLVQARRFVVAEVSVGELDAGAPRIAAVLAGEPLDGARHELAAEVKAITWHQLRVGRAEDGRWRARVILDL
jgi:SHS2 domain-containing protein